MKRSPTLFWALDGKIPRKVKSWKELRELESKPDWRRVSKTQIGDVIISTVFLGIDHNFNGVLPILFETMIFNGPHNDYQERYHTWDEAIAGHQRAVELVKFDGD